MPLAIGCQVRNDGYWLPARPRAKFQWLLAIAPARQRLLAAAAKNPIDFAHP
jgi:hypothetical protein